MKGRKKTMDEKTPIRVTEATKAEAASRIARWHEAYLRAVEYIMSAHADVSAETVVTVATIIANGAIAGPK
jgi:hypothetical protein